ncbi:MAG: extracellular solute-binding protein [Clostridia bacterium]
MKKNMCWCLALWMVLCMLPTFASGETRETITLTVTGARNPLTNAWQDTLMVPQLEERFGIKLDCQEFSQEDWKVQKGLLFASGDLPDLFLSADFSLGEAADYGAQGFLLPLNDMITDTTYTHALFGKNAGAKSVMTSPDGNIYTLISGSAIPANMVNRNWINEAWTERLGMKVPETLEELTAVLEAFKAQDANGNGNPDDEIPASGRVLDEIVLSALGFPTRSYAGVTLFVGEDGKPAMIAMDPRFETYLTYMRDSYVAGLLDNATFVQTNEEFQAKVAEGRIGLYASPAPWLYESAETAWDYRFFGGLTSAVNDKKIIGATNGMDSRGVTAITTSNPYPERTFEMLDWFYSDEGSTFGFINEEGVGWKWENEAEGDWSRVIPSDWTDSDEAYRCGVLGIVGGFNIYRDANWKLFKPTGNNIWLYDQFTEYAVPYFTQVFPTLPLLDEEQYEASTLLTDLNSYVNDAVVRFIVGEEELATGYATFHQTLQNMGAERYVEIYTAAYERYLGK